MKNITIETKTLPQYIIDPLRVVGFRGKEIYLRAVDRYSLTMSAGDGQRSVCVEIWPDGSNRFHQGSWGGSNMFTSNTVDRDIDGEDKERNPTREMLPGHPVFKGTKGHKFFYGVLLVHPEDFEKYKPEVRRHSMSDKAWLALKCIKGLNSRGRKEEFYRNRLGTYGPDNPLVQELISHGLLKKRGNGLSVTTEGKNAQKPKASEATLDRVQQEGEAALF